MWNLERIEFNMSDICTLADKLKNLKLEKRSFILEGKDTQDIDIDIKQVECELKSLEMESKPVLK